MRAPWYSEEDMAIFHRALDAWGVVAQRDMVVEEMAELTVELMKLGRSDKSLVRIVGELVDVLIMLGQLVQILKRYWKEDGGVDGTMLTGMSREYSYKMTRLEERLEAWEVKNEEANA